MGLFDFGAMVLLPGLREESESSTQCSLESLKGGGIQQLCRGTVSMRYQKSEAGSGLR